MTKVNVETHSDGIWISEQREKDTVDQLCQLLLSQGCVPVTQDCNNFGYPYVYTLGNRHIYCRLVDSVFLPTPQARYQTSAVVITDNHPLTSISGRMISLLPEFWSIWRFDPVYADGPATRGYNCFMNRIRGDRLTVFYELIKRNLLDQGFVSFNCGAEEYLQQHIESDLYRYAYQHQVGQNLIPYNSVESHGTLEQCIVDSNISLIMETYASDSHTVFSEKIFRALQLPRPWLLYSSPGAVGLLQSHGFDVLADCVDTGYDQIVNHGNRLQIIMNQLETVVDRVYSDQDYKRFAQAADHNCQLLQQFARAWPGRLNQVFDQIKNL
jgi:hypothetical protein